MEPAVARIARRMGAAIALCGMAMPVMAEDLVQTPHPVWVAATALSLSLVSAAIRPKD
jgi:hypothetical protein